MEMDKPATAPSEKRVTGVGGIFFKCKDPAAMKKWYHEHLGLPVDKYGTSFESRDVDNPDRKTILQWSTFKQDTKYFQPSTKDFMINYRVENLERLVEQLKAEGVTVVDKIEPTDYGKFCHIMDPEGNKIELWEPKD
jgi:predicted enzyme related to lactoylglutathione lyase